MEQVAAAAKGLPVIEDAAQSIGASRVINGKQVMAGEASAIGTFSFFPSKNLGGYGDGGMMVTQDDGYFDTLMKLRTHGGRQTYLHEIVGFNSRLDALQAAVLNVKLARLESCAAGRQKNAQTYARAFAQSGLDARIGVPTVKPGCGSVWNQYTIRVRGGRRDALQKYLADREIGSAIYYPVPLHLQKCFATLDYLPGSLPATEEAAAEVRDHERNGVEGAGDAADIQRIREADVEGARKPELVPNAHLENPAVHESDTPVLRDHFEDRAELLLPEVEMVHRGKEAGAPKPELAEGPLHPVEGIGGPRVQHEIGDEAIRITGGCRGDRLLVSRNARDQNRAVDAVPIELLHPAARELHGVFGRKLERELFPQDLGRRERAEETMREEVKVGVRDHPATVARPL